MNLKLTLFIYLPILVFLETNASFLEQIKLSGYQKKVLFAGAVIGGLWGLGYWWYGRPKIAGYEQDEKKVKTLENTFNNESGNFTNDFFYYDTKGKKKLKEKESFNIDEVIRYNDLFFNLYKDLYNVGEKYFRYYLPELSRREAAIAIALQSGATSGINEIKKTYEDSKSNINKRHKEKKENLAVYVVEESIHYRSIKGLLNVIKKAMKTARSEILEAPSAIYGEKVLLYSGAGVSLGLAVPVMYGIFQKIKGNFLKAFKK